MLTATYDPGRGSLEFELDGRPLGVACRGLAPPLVAAIAIDARATFTLVE